MKNKAFDIITVGSATLDIFLRSSEFKIRGKGKEKLVLEGGKLEVEKTLMSSGGGGTNTATGFSRLGFKTACVARLGDDLTGKWLASELAKEKFTKKYLRRIKGEVTDSSIILLSPTGKRVILVSRGGTRVDEERLIEMMGEDYIRILVKLGMGNKSICIYTTDLSYDYVKINAHYRT